MRTLILLVVLAAAMPAAGDIVYLRDGKWVEGNAKKTPNGYAVTDAKGHVTEYKQADVLSIELVAPKPDAGEVASRRLASLRRAVQSQEDLEAIIPKFEEFVKAHAGTPAAEEAQKDLVTWQERREQGQVKFGDRWIAPAERDQLLAQTVNQVDKARQLLKQNRIHDAEAIIQQVLELDAKNASALYLRGVILYRQDQLGPARKAFDTVNALTPDHGPTLNNLAVILWRQNQYVGALNYYDQAMLAAPNDKEILGNVAEALQALPQQYRENVVAKRVQRRFQEQDAAVQQQLSQQGLYRWGGTWVTQQKLDELKKAEQEVKGKLDALADEFDKTKERISQIGADIETNNRYLINIDQNALAVDPATGALVRLPYPQRYYDVQRDNDRLRASREEMVRRLEQLRVSAKRTQQELPTPRYSGLQKLLGEEFTPLKVADGAGNDASEKNAPAAIAPAQAPPPKPAPPRDLVAGPLLPATQPATGAATP